MARNFVESMHKDSKNRTQYVEVVVVDGSNTTTVRVVTDFLTKSYSNVTASFLGSNGFVHKIGSPMSLPVSPSKVLSHFASLSNLSAALTAEQVKLDDMDVMTLLAPVDSGFRKFPFFANLTDRLHLLTLQSHLIYPAGRIFSTDVVQSKGKTVNTSSGLELEITVDGDRVGFKSTSDASDETHVIVADILTDNGVIHLVDSVLRPILDTKDNSAVDNIFLNERLSGVAQLIADTPTFLDFLKTAKNITLFAPQTLPSDLSSSAVTVEALLAYHTLDAEVMSGDLKMGKNLVATRLADPEYVHLKNATQSLFVVASNTSVQLQSTYPADNVNVTYANLACAGNNVIHIVSAPAQVPQDTIPTLHAGEFAFLGNAFGNNSEFAKMVNGYEPNQFDNHTIKYTIFAARDSAYSSLSAEANTTELSVLQDQVLMGRALSSEFLELLLQHNGSHTITMLSGRNVTAELKGDDIYVAGWKVIETDILTANGVIHILEGAVGESSSSSSGLSAGVLAAIIVGGVAFLGLLCYCFFMKGEDGSDEETQPFARIP